jgi:hypothetical protein
MLWVFIVSGTYFLKKLLHIDLRWDVLFSLAQLVAVFILIPVTIFGFEIARREFEQSQAKPLLDLKIRQRGNQELAKNVLVEADSSQDWLSFKLELEITNAGKAVAGLYMIEICELSKLGLVGERKTSDWLEGIGTRADWQEDLKKNGRFVFYSKNQYPVFPGVELPLCTLLISLPAKITDKEFDIPYMIYTDNGKPREANLTVSLVRR